MIPAPPPERLTVPVLGGAATSKISARVDGLADGGDVIDALSREPWGASDGQVADRYGLRWLIGYEPGA
jgi:PhnB protein